MHIHILGICGTFMGGVALLARAAGHTVTGCDAGVYPPMSTMLEEQGVALTEGYGVEQMALKPDVFVIGNALSRGNPLVEAILESGAAYTSGAQWLSEHVLQGKWVLAVAGTHGKTTTTAILTWMLEHAGMRPGFLIGGVPQNFGVSARMGETDFFVIEADEYDTAFFDKRSKFVHYRPRTAILNNLEYDHADIFADLAAIETQFHHLVRTVPASGRLVVNGTEESLERVLARGCWSERELFGAEGNNDNADWQAANVGADDSFDVVFRGQTLGRVQTDLTGAHNRMNILAALAAARHVGVDPAAAIESLKTFKSVKRRLELRGTARGVAVYDDFAHHPTAIDTTVTGLKKRINPGERILAVLEPRSNTMKLGAMKAALPGSLQGADRVFGYGATEGKHALGWDLAGALSPLGERAAAFSDLDQLVAAVVREARAGDHVLVMSNGGFGGVHDKLLAALNTLIWPKMT